MNVIVAPHPDDELLGCYSVLTTPGCAVLYITDGNEAQAEGSALMAERFPGVQFFHACFPENEVDMVAGKLIGALSGLLKSLATAKEYCGHIEPITLYAPCQDDYHSDHRATWDACRAVGKLWRGAVQALYQYEVPSATAPGFCPNTYRYVMSSAKAMVMADCYPCEDVPARGAAVIQALATMRGGECGLAQAEAFRLIWRVE